MLKFIISARIRNSSIIIIKIFVIIRNILFCSTTPRTQYRMFRNYLKNEKFEIVIKNNPGRTRYYNIVFRAGRVKHRKKFLTTSLLLKNIEHVQLEQSYFFGTFFIFFFLLINHTDLKTKQRNVPDFSMVSQIQ